MSTFMAKKEEVKRDWIVVDLKGQVLGRAATQIADILRGKDRPTYTPHVDTGNFVVAINAKHIKLTGGKVEKKMYHKHSGYMGGLTSMNADEMLEKHPEDLIMKAVKGMLPKNFLAKKIIKKLRVYAESEHPHQAGKPVETKLAN